MLDPVKKDLVFDAIDIDTTSEVVFAKLQLGKNLTRIIGATYRPPSSNDTMTNYVIP